MSLALGAWALALPASALAADFTVNDDTAGPGPGNATCASPDFTGATAIQAAIDGATAGDTILVCAGAYPESVNINKRLTLLGAQSGVDAEQRGGPTARRESLITGTGASDGGVAVNSSGSTLDGFAVAFGGDPAIGANIATSSANNAHTIVNNIVRGGTIGISANTSGGTPSVIQHNAISNNNVPGPAGGTGIYADGNLDDLLIDSNYFTDQRNAAILLTETLGGTSQNVDITRNTFRGSSGVSAENELRVLLLYTDGALIRGNTFTDVANNAVQLADGNINPVITRNSMTGGGFAAVHVTDSGIAGENSGAVVIGNTMLGNDAAVNINADSHAGALTARGNRIAGNTTGIVNDDADATVAADDNWWGCNEGPAAPDCDPIGGTGAAAVDASELLRLILAAPARIRAAKPRPVRARVAGGAPCAFPNGARVGFAATKGLISPASSPTADCAAAATLRAGPRDRGVLTVSATLDNETVTDSARIRQKRRKNRN